MRGDFGHFGDLRLLGVGRRQARGVVCRKKRRMEAVTLGHGVLLTIVAQGVAYCCRGALVINRFFCRRYSQINTDAC